MDPEGGGITTEDQQGLVNTFVRVGVPRERHQLYIAVYRRIKYRISSISGPLKPHLSYHPQIDGLVEHFNKTFK